jgi:hypothetical protein
LSAGTNSPSESVLPANAVVRNSPKTSPEGRVSSDVVGVMDVVVAWDVVVVSAAVVDDAASSEPPQAASSNAGTRPTPDKRVII